MLFINALLFGAATAAVLPRANSVMTDLQTIDSDTKKLITAENNYNGGVFAAYPVKTAADNLDSAIKSATSDASSSSKLSESDSQAAIDYVNSTLEPDVANAINILISKKSEVASDGLTSTVQGELQTLSTDTKSYSAALNKITPTDKQAAASSAVAKVLADIQRGVNAYSS